MTTAKVYEVQMLGTDTRRPATADEIAFVERLPWNVWFFDFVRTNRTGWDEFVCGLAGDVKTIYRRTT